MDTPQQEPGKFDVAFPKKTNRTEHLIRTIAFFAFAFIALAILNWLNPWARANPNKSFAQGPLVYPIITLAILYVVGVLVPRVRSVGWNPMLLLLLLVPIVGLLLWLALFFIPPKNESP